MNVVATHMNERLVADIGDCTPTSALDNLFWLRMVIGKLLRLRLMSAKSLLFILFIHLIQTIFFRVFAG